MAAKFVPRTVFPKVDSIPKTYFLGHHKTAFEQMKSMLSSVDHVIECRDFRIPATSINPLLEEVIGDRLRTIVYMKRDLGGNLKLEAQQQEKTISRWDRKSTVYYIGKPRQDDIIKMIKWFRKMPLRIDQLFGHRVMVVGMPNVGKSTLINTLRGVSIRKAKAARTGMDPGVTRKIGNRIKIMEKKTGSVYLYDTPGVFVPYMPDQESMLKLALCGSVKDAIIPITVLADYLLFHLNLHNPLRYSKFSKPTNDIIELLKAIAVQSGRLAKGGVPDVEAAARYFLSMWRSGKLGTFILDDLDAETQKRKEKWLATPDGTEHQAKEIETRTRQLEGSIKKIEARLKGEQDDESAIRELIWKSS